MKDLGGCVGVRYFRGRHRTEQFATTVDDIQDREQHCRACMHRERARGRGHGERARGVGMGSRLSSRSSKPCEMNEMQ